jgi:hypothetical protein
MLRFFRNIRQKLLENGNLRKYFWYALGEILLVVIGILIALQINNWNQSRIENNELVASLNSIAKNMEQDIAAAQKMIAVKDSARILAAEYISIMKVEEINPERFFDMMSAIFVEDYININDSGYEALKNSGLLGKLRDTEFEQLLFEYYDVVQEARDQEVSTNEFIEAMEAAAGAKGTFIPLFDMYFSEKELTIEQMNTAFQNVLNDPAVAAAAGRVSIRTNLIVQYEALISAGTHFIDLVSELE